MFYTRLEHLCKEAGTSVADVAENVLHVSSGTPTGWTRGAAPKATTVELAARHFRVSADYLLGLTTDKQVSAEARALEPDEIDLIDALRAAPPPVRQAVMRMTASALSTPDLAPAGSESARARQRAAGAERERKEGVPALSKFPAPGRAGRTEPTAPGRASRAGRRRARRSRRCRRTSAGFSSRSNSPASSISSCRPREIP